MIASIIRIEIEWPLKGMQGIGCVHSRQGFGCFIETGHRLPASCDLSHFKIQQEGNNPLTESTKRRDRPFLSKVSIGVSFLWGRETLGGAGASWWLRIKRTIGRLSATFSAPHSMQSMNVAIVPKYLCYHAS
jgi:hypothetical protein